MIVLWNVVTNTNSIEYCHRNLIKYGQISFATLSESANVNKRILPYSIKSDLLETEFWSSITLWLNLNYFKVSQEDRSHDIFCMTHKENIELGIHVLINDQCSFPNTEHYIVKCEWCCRPDKVVKKGLRVATFSAKNVKNMWDLITK